MNHTVSSGELIQHNGFIILEHVVALEDRMNSIRENVRAASTNIQELTVEIGSGDIARSFEAVSAGISAHDSTAALFADLINNDSANAVTTSIPKKPLPMPVIDINYIGFDDQKQPFASLSSDILDAECEALTLAHDIENVNKNAITLEELENFQAQTQDFQAKLETLRNRLKDIAQVVLDRYNAAALTLETESPEVC